MRGHGRKLRPIDRRVKDVCEQQLAEQVSLNHARHDEQMPSHDAH